MKKAQLENKKYFSKSKNVVVKIKCSVEGLRHRVEERKISKNIEQKDEKIQIRERR